MSVSALVTTAGAANANAYVSEAQADQFHEDRPPAGTTWATATSDQKKAAILWATKQLDALVVWEGVVVTSTQALLWPRSGLIYPSGYTVPSTIIPAALENACAEFARQLLAADRTADSDIETQGVKSITAGPVSLTFSDSVVAKVLPDVVANLLPSEWVKYIRSRNPSVRELLRA